MSFNIDEIRRSFPILSQQVHGKPLVYLDNAATTQKPIAVIDALKNFYETDNANVHRGVHLLSQRSTDRYEAVREKIQDRIGAANTEEIIFTKGATEAINLVVSTFGQSLGPGDEVLVSIMEHHSNFVPWQMLCQKTGATLKVIPITEECDIDLAVLKTYLTDKVKILAITQASNTLGTLNPVKSFVQLAKEKSITVLIDGTQAVPHMPINVVDLGCDFYVFSSHKMYGPTGVGVLYGKQALLKAMPPYQFGGDMIKAVSIEKTIFNDLPCKFEAGTPNIAGVIGFGAAIDYLNEIGLDVIAQREQQLTSYAREALSKIEGLSIIGNPQQGVSVLSFVMDTVHPHDIGTIMDQAGIAVRAGHHCTMPLMDFLNISGTARLSLAFYNTFEEIDKAVMAIKEVRKVFGL